VTGGPLPTRVERRRRSTRRFWIGFAVWTAVALAVVSGDPAIFVLFAGFHGVAALVALVATPWMRRNVDAEDQRRLEVNRVFWSAAARSLGAKRYVQTDVTAPLFANPRLVASVDGVEVDVRPEVVRGSSRGMVRLITRFSFALPPSLSSLTLYPADDSMAERVVTGTVRRAETGDAVFDAVWRVPADAVDALCTAVPPAARAHLAALKHAPWAQGMTRDIRDGQLIVRVEKWGESAARWATDDEVVRRVRAGVAWSKMLAALLASEAASGGALSLTDDANPGQLAIAEVDRPASNRRAVQSGSPAQGDAAS